MVGSGIHLEKRLSRAGKTALIGALAAVMSWVVLFGTLQAALSVPLEERLAPLARVEALDYSSSNLGVFESLRSSFIAQILGLEELPREESRVASSNGGAQLAAPTSPMPTDLLPGRLPRTVVEHEFDNDGFEDAYPISGIPFTGKTRNEEAGREPGEPDSCEAAGGTVWYRYTPDRRIALIANTFGSDHAVALAVFEGQDKNDLTLKGCEFHRDGNARVVFSARKNHSYFFQLTAPVRGGNLVFSLDPLGTTSLVSFARSGKETGNGESKYSAISADGRYVSFQSAADNIGRDKETKHCFWGTSRETRDCRDVYVRDLRTGDIEVVSKNSEGVTSNGHSWGSAISGDGRFVVFYSIGDNLVPNDDNDSGDIFVHDRMTHKTERVTVSSDGAEGTSPWAGTVMCHDKLPPLPSEWEHGKRDGCKMEPIDPVAFGISSDGRYVVFASPLHGLVDPEPPHCTDLTRIDFGGANHGPGVPIPVDVGPQGCHQVYVHDRKTRETRLVSVSSDGVGGNGDSAGPFISRNGRWVAFSSSADNLVDHDENQYRDVFVHDLRTGTTELASLSSFGQQANAQSGGVSQRGHATISDNGRWVAFVSHASNLTSDDGNYTDDVFLRDMSSRQTILITGESEDLSSSGHSSISTDGRHIAFTSELEPRKGQDLFVYDRLTDTTTLVSVSTSGEAASEGSFSQEPELSADGHFVVFHSDACNLDRRYRDACGDTFNFDIFVHELPWTR